MNGIIRLEHVVKVGENGRRAVNDISFHIQRKECVVIQGGPGSGKTALARLIAGMDRPSDGTVYVAQRAVHQMDADTAADFRSRTFGILPRNPAFLEYLTVSENVELSLAMAGISASSRKKTVDAQLETMGLQYAAGAHPSQLSNLEACKLSIARAVITQPPVLLIDDVAAGLSEKDAGWVRNFLRALWRSGDYTMLEFADEENALSEPDRVLHLAHGRLGEAA